MLSYTHIYVGKVIEERPVDFVRWRSALWTVKATVRRYPRWIIFHYLISWSGRLSSSGGRGAVHLPICRTLGKSESSPIRSRTPPVCWGTHWHKEGPLRTWRWTRSSLGISAGRLVIDGSVRWKEERGERLGIHPDYCLAVWMNNWHECRLNGNLILANNYRSDLTSINISSCPVHHIHHVCNHALLKESTMWNSNKLCYGNCFIDWIVL